ncbi:MAG TPA: hypothetical protein VFQ30_09885 [Ktedonobacteraceae bacterium]|nr:hypothetical protein [Ktedonobacteraceae bacterium]
MTSIEKQGELARLIRTVNDAQYRLHLALFKFQALFFYSEQVPESAFEEVETALVEVALSVETVRATMAIFLTGSLRSHDDDVVCWQNNRTDVGTD